MDLSPLITAHDHARAASVATQSSDFTVAINEHALAAGEFAKAASGTASVEALRTLRLLEQHHQRLSDLLKAPLENPSSIPGGDDKVQDGTEKPLSTSAAVAELRASKSSLGSLTNPALRCPPNFHNSHRLPSRDLISSIASNLASARGIRANYARQPSQTSVSTQQSPAKLAGNRRSTSSMPPNIPEHNQPSWIPPTHVGIRKAEPQTSTSHTSVKAEPSNNLTTDEGFSRFYSTFENLLSKISAPLAFAGLPLVAEEEAPLEPPTTSPAPRKKDRHTKEKSSAIPDLSKYISRAALRSTAADPAVTDSFCVVPTSGHTVSYAQILSYEEKEKRRRADADEDDFFDAREVPAPNSPSSSRRSLTGGMRFSSSKDMGIRVEELDLENKSLKEVVDKLSKRLHAFEMAAQNSTLALQESIRMTRATPPVRDRSHPVDEGASRQKIVELEDRLLHGEREIERLARENEKLKSVVSRFRERWEKLKDGAKTRRDGVKESAKGP